MSKCYYVYLLVDVVTGTHRYTAVTEDLHYRNAYIHGTNAWSIFKYLPKLVNE